MNIPSDIVPGGPGGERSGEEAAQKAAQEQELRNDLLTRILEPAAKERCMRFTVFPPANVPDLKLVSRIGLVSKERFQQIQTVLLRMAQGGQLRSKVTEAQLIDLLDQVC